MPKYQTRLSNSRSSGEYGFRLLCCFFVLTFASVCDADEATASAGVEDRTFVAEFDGSEQKYVVVPPKDMELNQPVSVLVVLHGHGSGRWQFVRQDRGECRGTRDVAAAHKMLLISPDYRAKTSWMGPAAEADILQIIHTMKTEYCIQRIILCGGSMGGTGALTFTAMHPKLIDGVVSLNGTANLVDYTRFQDAIAASYGGTKQQVPDEYHKRSAEFFPERFTMPLAATTGGKDEVVPPGSVLRLVDRVRQHNSKVLSIHRPDDGHSTTYEDTTRALEFVIAATESHRSSTD